MNIDHKTKKVKLFDELMDNYHEIVTAFVLLNKSNTECDELLIVAAGAAISHASQNILALSKIMKDKSQITELLKKSEGLFSKNMKEILENLE